jgi:lactoylglutathione lyase
MILRRALFLLSPIGSGLLPFNAARPERPPITKIVNFVVKTDNLDEARRFYSGVLGHDEVFRRRRTISGPAELSAFKVKDHQYIEVAPTLQNAWDDKLIQIGFETGDGRKLRNYLAGKSVSVPSRVSEEADGNVSFVLKDPEGHNIEFLEYLEGSLQSKYLTPDGDNWIEYMVEHDGPPTPKQAGVWHHVWVGTLYIQTLYKTVMDRGYKPPNERGIHPRDGRWLLQLYDKNDTRTEVMVRKPVQKPCCSENMDPYIK